MQNSTRGSTLFSQKYSDGNLDISELYPPDTPKIQLTSFYEKWKLPVYIYFFTYKALIKNTWILKLNVYKYMPCKYLSDKTN